MTVNVRQQPQGVNPMLESTLIAGSPAFRSGMVFRVSEIVQNHDAFVRAGRRVDLFRVQPAGRQQAPGTYEVEVWCHGEGWREVGRFDAMPLTEAGLGTLDVYGTLATYAWRVLHDEPRGRVDQETFARLDPRPNS